MNPRMPYYIPQSSSTSDYHHGYAPVPHWTDFPTEPPINNPQNYRNNWKRPNRNWQSKYNREQTSPYAIPKKGFIPRFQRNRFDNGNGHYYDTNGHQNNWPHKVKGIKSPDGKDSEQGIPGIIANKKKRKPMSKSYPTNKWDEKDAAKALQAEKDFIKNLKKQSLIIRFPDPDLSKEIVQNFHPLIESVHFPHASTPRYCFAHLEETADITKVVNALEKIPFGQGFLNVDIKKPREELCEVSPKDIDPYTLYVGNLPMNVTKQGVVQQFPGCTRIDIGHPQQLKNTRYAFVRFATVDGSIKAYQSTRNTQFESRSLIVRFRRINGNVGVPGESKQATTIPAKTKSESQAEQTIVASPIIEYSTKLPITVESETEPVLIIPEKNSKPEVPDLNIVKEEPASDHEDNNIDVKPVIPVGNGLNPVVKREIKHELGDNGNTPTVLRNEDDIEHAEDEEDYINDNFQYAEGPSQEEYEDEDDYEDDDDGGSDLDLNDTFLPYDDDGDF